MQQMPNYTAFDRYFSSGYGEVLLQHTAGGTRAGCSVSAGIFSFYSEMRAVVLTAVFLKKAVRGSSAMLDLKLCPSAFIYRSIERSIRGYLWFEINFDTIQGII